MIDERNQQNPTKRNRSYGAKDFGVLQPSRAATQPGSYSRKDSVVFFGNERLATGVTTGAPTLSALIDSGYEIAAVVTNYSEAVSRNSRELEIKNIAKKHNIPLIIPEKLSDIKTDLKAFGAEVGILVAFGKIIPEDIINVFPKGIVNVHPSLLPKHRGPTPIESTILGGDVATGVSVMQLVKAMDAGPVYAQSEVKLTGTESKQFLADHLGKLGSELIIKHLPAILASKLKPTPQNDAEATYDSQITKLNGSIDWNLRADSIERQIRAYAGWPGSRSELLGKEVIIIEGEVIDKTGIPGEVIAIDKQLVVCSGEKAINVLKLKPAGKQEMTGQAFLAGYGKHLRS